MKKRYGGARTNSRIIAIRDQDSLSRKDLARYCHFDRGTIDNWLLPTNSKNWRRAPERAVALLEFETGRRMPTGRLRSVGW